jgi:DNA-binding CsgD family transcriptional regulator
MVEKGGLNYPDRFYLTDAEKEVLHLLTDEFLTIKQIQQQRNCSLQAVYKIIKKLKQKGAFNNGLNKVENIEPTFNLTDLRLHSQEMNIRIISQSPKYQTDIEKSNTLFIDGNTIRLYKNSIEIYSGQTFYGKTVDESEKKSLDYWKRFIARLEHDLNIILMKNRARNIKIVNQHWARGDSEICDNSREYRERVWVYAEEDGKLAFITDDSFGFREDETVHPITAKRDRQAIDKQVNDWRLNNPPTNSELSNISKDTLNAVNSLIEIQRGLPENLALLKEQIASHLKLIQEYRKENIKWRKNKTEEIRKNIGQKKLSDFT